MSRWVIVVISCFIRRTSKASAVRWAIMRGMKGGRMRAGIFAAMRSVACTAQPVGVAARCEDPEDARRDFTGLELVGFLRDARIVTRSAVAAMATSAAGGARDRGLNRREEEAEGALLPRDDALDAGQRGETMAGSLRYAAPRATGHGKMKAARCVV